MPLLVLILFFISCSPTSLALNQTKLISFYFDKKISKMEDYDIKDYLKQRKIVQTKIEYAYGILMEKGDRLIDDDYEEGISYYKKANKLFTEAKELSLTILSNRYPNFIQWMKNDLYIKFKKEDISDLYWLIASMAGSIQSSRGVKPL